MFVDKDLSRQALTGLIPSPLFAIVLVTGCCELLHAYNSRLLLVLLLPDFLKVQLQFSLNPSE